MPRQLHIVGDAPRRYPARYVGGEEARQASRALCSDRSRGQVGLQPQRVKAAAGGPVESALLLLGREWRVYLSLPSTR